MIGIQARTVRLASLVLAAAMGATGTHGEPLESALVRAYLNNPALNSARAGARATDENVPQALAGYRPKVALTATGGEQSISGTTKITSALQGGPIYSTDSGYNSPFSVGLTLTQNLFDGFQTTNRTRQAEAQIMAARAALANTEQTVLLESATAYMNLLRDFAILDLQRRNVEVLQQQLRQTRERFNVGEVTRTDVAQAEASIAAGRSQVLIAESNYAASRATYRQVIGVEPGRLVAAAPVDRFSPHSLAGAVTLGMTANPLVTAAQYNVDVAMRQVKIAEGALSPSVSMQASLQQGFLGVGLLSTMQSNSASVFGTLTVPIYQGGAEYSLIRQAKELLGQRRLDLDTVRDQVRQAVIQAWGQVQAASGNIKATTAQVQAAEIALNGVRDEAAVGQRTTFDVLTAQQTLVNARVAMVTAQHDRVVASYTLLAAVGRLNPRVLGLRVPVYRPQLHYQMVRDAWAGTRAADGR